MTETFINNCTDSLRTLQTTFATEPNNYKANAYYSNKKLYMNSASTYDKAVLIKIV